MYYAKNITMFRKFEILGNWVNFGIIRIGINGKHAQKFIAKYTNIYTKIYPLCKTSKLVIKSRKHESMHPLTLTSSWRSA
jgi:hypothetical protein